MTGAPGRSLWAWTCGRAWRFAAIAAIVGAVRVAEATGRIALAIGVAIEVAEQEFADQLDDGA